MALEPPIWLEAAAGDPLIQQSARQYRTVTDAVFSVEGIATGPALAVSPRALGANMSVDVSAGMCVIEGDSQFGTQGMYVQRSTAVENRTITAAPTSGSRTDIIVAQLHDKQADNGTGSNWTITVLPGTTAVPPSTLLLATITVPAGTASITAGNIADGRVLTATGARVYWTGDRFGGGSTPNGGWTLIQSWGASSSSGITYSLGYFTVPAPGHYVVSGQVSYQSQAAPAGQVVVRLHMGGTLVDDNGARPDSAYSTRLKFAGAQRLNAGDTIWVEAYQSSGASQSLDVGAGLTHIDIVLTT